MNRISYLVLSLLALGCSDAVESVEREHTEALSAAAIDARAASLRAREFADARSFFTQPEDVDAWFALTFALKSEFDAICGDTFCEGDVSNIESLAFRCSVETKRGTLGSCVWVFAGSQDEVVPATGAVRVDGRLWRCKAPLAPSTPARDFVSALSAPGVSPLFAPLPGTARSLFDGLGECL